MRLIAVAAVLATAGCASYAERQAQPPWHVVDSSKAPAEFVACVAPLLRDPWPGMTVAPDGDATVLALPLPSHGVVLASVTVEPTAAGSRASLRSATETGAYRRAAGYMDGCR